MTLPDQTTVKDIMREAANKCILPLFQNLNASDIHEKSCATDLVTRADIESEALIEQRVRALYPGVEVLGEECASKDARKFGLLQQVEQPYFVIDPVDGTSNFVAGTPHFGMILSYVHAGEVAQSYIYDVLNDHFMTAEKGAGTYDGDQPVYMETNHLLKQGIGRDKYFGTELKYSFNAATQSLQISSAVLGCSAHEYLNLLRGQDRFYFACNVKPWDHLAGSLMVREAGGVCHKWDGLDYAPKDLGASILSANSSEDWEYLYDALLKPVTKDTSFTVVSKRAVPKGPKG